ncbi:poly(A) polymerase Cid12 [Schizosaccharomyces cryophilus OY26]|uniref:polynucleotide adenylyltransferase n=1 Tax=Schizosaccharomyces cryophilus (strain OY26 / ATCC MYA-4695 / CBS 11777 / NBRC 106824 / NRRL Y48691) TaxID=653667 RepID=S9X4J5_SCHCR|nr:poly(A) polymerase Cid12 [Schizosaccharomyces cryophilus OY26]EPY51997.1 poly(A) polymerase Cid12 [Schizosaccharomyces cryophilus OY26]
MGRLLLNLQPVPWEKEGLNDNERILSFLDFIRPKPTELEYRKQIVQKLQDYLQRVLSNPELQEYGSLYTGLSLNISDIDLSLKSPAVGEMDKRRVTMFLRTYMDPNTEFHFSARVPRVYLHDVSGIAIDLTFANENACLSAELQSTYCRKNPEYGTLLMLLKHWTYERDLDCVHLGGISSCALSYMLIGWLEMRYHKKDISSKERPLRSLLQSFFQFWGAEWCYELFVLRPLTGQIVPKLQKGWYDEAKPTLLSIEDPLDKDNDIGKQSFQITMIQAAFLASYNELLSDKDWLNTFAITEAELKLYEKTNNAMHPPSLVSQYCDDDEEF